MISNTHTHIKCPLKTYIYIYNSQTRCISSREKHWLLQDENIWFFELSLHSKRPGCAIVRYSVVVSPGMVLRERQLGNQLNRLWFPLTGCIDWEKGLHPGVNKHVKTYHKMRTYNFIAISPYHVSWWIRIISVSWIGIIPNKNEK